MFRYYFIHDGRISQGGNLPAETLDEAIALSRSLLTEQPSVMNFGGIEIWQQANLLYSDKCHAADSGSASPIVSPFQTPETVMFLTSRPSMSHSLAKLMHTTDPEI